MSSYIRRFAVLAVALSSVGAFAAMEEPSMAPGLGNARYATDAYPGFDNDAEDVKPERKEPRWFSFIYGPKMTNAAEQFAYCEKLIAEESFSKARGELDALVREWPTAPEAWKAQQMLAEVLFDKLNDYEEAFDEYRYLLDFYSLQCDYKAIADRLYQVAGVLKIEGKEVMFVRFANTVDVRRAFETCVLRAPGAAWVPEALLTIALLREDEGKLGEAVKVYENLRNLYLDSDEAKTAFFRESLVRMQILKDHGYNRVRCRDTADFLRLALRSCKPSDAVAIRESLNTVLSMIEDEAYESAKFYDSTTRTRRSAVNAYEKFLEEFPDSARADAVRARLEELKGEQK